MEILLLSVFPVFLPLISMLCYSGERRNCKVFKRVLTLCKNSSVRIIQTYFLYRREVLEILDSNPEIYPEKYRRFLLLGCMDVLITLPMEVFQLILGALQAPLQDFWLGWSLTHNWDQIPQVTAEEWKTDLGAAANAQIRWAEWRSSVFAVVFIVIFGLSKEARATYKRGFWSIVKPFGWKQSGSRDVTISTLECKQGTLDPNPRT